MTLGMFFHGLEIAATSSSLFTSIEAMLLSDGIRWNEIPGGGVNPVAPPWLNSSVRSIYQ
jgi:hypothetical protein